MQPYHVTHQDGRTEFRPTGGFASLLVGLFALGAAFSGYQGIILVGLAPGEWPAVVVGGAFCLAALVLITMAYRGWRTRNTPLAVSPIEGVVYGTEQLCSGGEVRYVAVIPSRGGEPGDCEVVFALDGERQQTIPSQYFGSYRSWEHAQPFAEQLAHALAVTVRKEV